MCGFTTSILATNIFGRNPLVKVKAFHRYRFICGFWVMGVTGAGTVVRFTNPHFTVTHNHGVQVFDRFFSL